MAYFAQKLRYGAHDGEEGASYMAFIKLTKKKGGKPVEFVLYLRVIQYNYPAKSRSKMIRFKAETDEEAIKRFWPLDEGTGKEFPGWKSNQWENTTLWLAHVALGQLGRWARVGTPAPWSKRRKKKLLQFGNIAHILLVHQARFRGLKQSRSELELELSILDGYDEEDNCLYGSVNNDTYTEYSRVAREVEKIEEEIDSAYATIKATRAEMRYKVRRMFPKPVGIIPKRVSRPKESRSTPW